MLICTWIISLFMCVALCVYPEDFVEYINKYQGVKLSVPSHWTGNDDPQDQRTYFNLPQKNAFLETSVIDPVGEDYSTVNVDFFLADLLYSLKYNNMVSELLHRKIVLSGLDAYRIDFAYKTDNVPMHLNIMFTGARERIYFLRFVSSEKDRPKNTDALLDKIISSYTIMDTSKLEARYLQYQNSAFNFSFSYPAQWRLNEMNVSAQPTMIYQDQKAGINIMGDISGRKANIRAPGYDMPFYLAPDPDSSLVLNIIHVPGKVDIPAYVIESYAKSVQKGAKELKGYKHLRQFQSTISKQLAMEYVYRYIEKGKEETFEKECIVKYYVTFAHHELYVLIFSAPDEQYSRHFKSVENLVKSFSID
ncbi:MAG: hypothetical protein Q8Q33_02115 [Chlamydiota bacterium]|nr:hypothetical protein [Chlamydiota bacterium]